MDSRCFGVASRIEDVSELLDDLRENLQECRSPPSPSLGSVLERVISIKTSAKSLELESNALEAPSMKLQIQTNKINYYLRFT